MAAKTQNPCGFKQNRQKYSLTNLLVSKYFWDKVITLKHNSYWSLNFKLLKGYKTKTTFLNLRDKAHKIKSATGITLQFLNLIG